jgi:hypothetical protein
VSSSLVLSSIVLILVLPVLVGPLLVSLAHVGLTVAEHVLKMPPNQGAEEHSQEVLIYS